MLWPINYAGHEFDFLSFFLLFTLFIFDYSLDGKSSVQSIHNKARAGLACTANVFNCILFCLPLTILSSFSSFLPLFLFNTKLAANSLPMLFIKKWNKKKILNVNWVPQTWVTSNKCTWSLQFKITFITFKLNDDYHWLVSHLLYILFFFLLWLLYLGWKVWWTTSRCMELWSDTLCSSGGEYLSQTLWLILSTCLLTHSSLLPRVPYLLMMIIYANYLKKWNAAYFTFHTLCSQNVKTFCEVWLR